MKLWIDDIRPAPDGWHQCYSVNEAKEFIVNNYDNLEIVDLDHDSGDYYNAGGDYIKILDWLENYEAETDKKVKFSFHIHSMNPVGRKNMQYIIEGNNWKYIN